MRENKRIAVFTAIGLLIVAAVMFAKGCFGEAKAPASVTASSSGSSSSTNGGAATGPAPVTPPPAIDEATMQKLTSIARLEQMLADYKANAIYPPWSRIHDEGTKYKLEWNKPAVSDLPLSEGEKPLTYRFAADKAHVNYGETYTSWIEAWEGDDDQKRVPLKISQAYIMSVGGDKEGRLVALEYKDDGKLRYTSTITPSSMPELQKAQQVRLSAVIEHGESRRMIVREFTYAPRKLLVVNAVSDSIKDGNLVIGLDVDVLEKGIYSFEGNVMSGDGSVPVGWYAEDRPLEAGKQLVECRVLGKIFTDKGVDGPYLVKDIRGLLRFLDSNEMPITWRYEGTHLTKAYKTADFSSKEWDAPEKRDKISGMEKLIADTKAGKVGQPVEKAKHIHIDENGKITEVE